MAIPEDALECWFADTPESPAATKARASFWFGSDPAQDGEIWELFADPLADAAAGHYDDWAENVQGRLALIILFDQFPRNMYRGTAEVYRYDMLARALAQAGVAAGQLAELSVPEQGFFLMPYQHSEDLEMQNTGLELMQAMVNEAAPEWREVAQRYYSFALRHKEIVERYGRFPHRNNLLGRLSTDAEVRFFAEGGETFGQAS